MSWLSVAWHWYKDNVAALTPLGAFAGGGLVAWAALRQASIANSRHLAQTEADRERRDIESSRHLAQTEADRERRITENFSKAVDQLGSDKLATRLGGIYALERLSQESERDHWLIMETLTAFVREGRPSSSAWAPISPTGRAAIKAEPSQKGGIRPATDIQEALRVLGRRDEKARMRDRDPKRVLRFEGANLQGADLTGTMFQFAVFSNANLEGADLTQAHLEHAVFSNAHLEGANLSLAHLEYADLMEAHLAHAQLHSAHLDEAHLELADLKRASLHSARLPGAHLFDAKLYSTNLMHADLQRADLGGANFKDTELLGANLERAIGLTQSQVDAALGDEGTKLPEGLQRPAHWSTPKPN